MRLWEQQLTVGRAVRKAAAAAAVRRNDAVAAAEVAAEAKEQATERLGAVRALLAGMEAEEAAEAGGSVGVTCVSWVDIV